MQAEGRVTESIASASASSSRSALYTKSVPFTKFHRLALNVDYTYAVGISNFY